jgi:hypothetical protein
MHKHGLRSRHRRDNSEAAYALLRDLLFSVYMFICMYVCIYAYVHVKDLAQLDIPLSGIFLGVKAIRSVRPTSPPPLSRLSRNCKNVYVPELYGPPLHVTRIALVNQLLFDS